MAKNKSLEGPLAIKHQGLGWVGGWAFFEKEAERIYIKSNFPKELRTFLWNFMFWILIEVLYYDVLLLDT